jgi:ABC-2 type transport system permease protein
VRAVLTILAKDLRLRLRDRSAIVVGVVAPFGLAFILNMVTGGFGEDFSATFGVVDEDRGEVSAAFTRVVEDLDDDIEVRTGLSEDEARRQVDGGDLDAAFILPASFSERVTSIAGPAQVRVLGNVDAQIATSIARAVAEGFTERLNAVRLSVAVALAGDGEQGGEADRAEVAELVAAAQREQPPVQVSEATATDRQLDGTTYLMAGMAVFFSFFLVQYGVVGLLEERRGGTMARLLAAPVPRLAIPLAKALTSFVLGVSGLLVLAVGSTLLLGADWGPAPAVVMLVAAVVLAAVSLVGVVAGVARTPEQAGGMQSVIAMALGLLGGSFFPVDLGDGPLSRLAVVTPHHWFLRGLGEARGGGVADALPAVLALLAFAAAVSCLGAVLVRRTVEP